MGVVSIHPVLQIPGAMIQHLTEIVGDDWWMV